MSLERVLVVLLAITSTLAAGLAADARGTSTITRRQIILVTIANVVALPLATYALVHVMALDGTRALVLVAAAPGGSTGPLLAVLGRGDARTGATTFFVLTLAGTIAASIATMALDVAAFPRLLAASSVVAFGSLGPLVAGLAIRARRPSIARVWQPWLSRTSLVLLVATIGVLAARHGDVARADALCVGGCVSVLALSVGALVTGRASRIAVAQVSAVRNLTLVLLVLAVVDAAPAETMAVLAYGLSMYVVTLGAALWWRSAMTRA